MKYAIKITPKEKALLIERTFFNTLREDRSRIIASGGRFYGNKFELEAMFSLAKKFSILHIDGIIQNCNEFGKLEGTTYGLLEYWEEVKQEIEKI